MTPGVRIVCISDTHMRHPQLKIPACDVLIHAGDVTRRGTFAELEQFVAWFSAQPATHRVFIAGNHDLCCERRTADVRELAQAQAVTYLQDEGATVEGLKLYGSPVTPTFRNMAFNRDPGPPIAKYWAPIPEDLDILITHGPPRGVLDRMVLGKHVGCVDLLQRVRTVRPRAHVFGHIHEARGTTRVDGLPTQFINAANSRLLPIGQRGPTWLDLGSDSLP